MWTLAIFILNLSHLSSFLEWGWRKKCNLILYTGLFLSLHTWIEFLVCKITPFTQHAICVTFLEKKPSLSLYSSFSSSVRNKERNLMVSTTASHANCFLVQWHSWYAQWMYTGSLDFGEGSGVSLRFSQCLSRCWLIVAVAWVDTRPFIESIEWLLCPFGDGLLGCIWWDATLFLVNLFLQPAPAVSREMCRTCAH